MNIIHTRAIIIAGAFAIFFASPTSAQTFTSTFESEDELANYNLYTSGGISGGSSPSAAGQFVYSPAGGVMGSGGVSYTLGTPTDVTAIYQQATFDLTKPGSLTISGFFRTNSDTSVGSTGAVFQIGFSANNTTGMYGSSGAAFLSSRVFKSSSSSSTFRLETQDKEAAGTAIDTLALNAGTFSLANDNWYKLSFTVTPTDLPGYFEFSTSLEDWGSTGAALVALIAGVQDELMQNDALYADSTTFAAFRSVEGRANSAIDNLTVIPEPSSILLLVSASVGLLSGRRRRVTAPDTLRP